MGEILIICILLIWVVGVHSYYNPKNGGKTMPVKFNKSPSAVARRQRVIERLEKQLKDGYRPFRGKETPNQEDLKIVDDIPKGVILKDSDIKRITKEIEILKTRL